MFNSLSAAVYWTAVFKHLRPCNQYDRGFSVLFKHTHWFARAHTVSRTLTMWCECPLFLFQGGGRREAAVQCKPSHWWREAVNMRSQSAPHFLKMGRFVSPAWITTPCSLGLWWGAAALTTGLTSINCFFFFYFAVGQVTELRANCVLIRWHPAGSVSQMTISVPKVAFFSPSFW